MTLEERANVLRSRAEAAQGGQETKAVLMDALDLLSQVCRMLSLFAENSEAVNAYLDSVEERLDALEGDTVELGVDDYFGEDDQGLYEVKCPACGDKFTVDEATFAGGFQCPTCGQQLIGTDDEKEEI